MRFGGRLLLPLLAAVALVARGGGAAPHSADPAPAPVSFRDHKVLRVVPATDRQVREVRQFLADHPALDAWLDPSAPGRPVDVRANASDAAAFTEFLAKLDLTPRDMIPDLGRLVDEEQRQMLDAKRANPDFGWDSYHTLEEINKWLQDLVQRYPDVVSLVEGGKSYEGRPLLGVKIKSAQEEAPIAVLEAGIHAREWITPASATFFINEILTSEDDDFKKAVRGYEWHIFPSTNPDGYHYTHTVNRMWRKSRSKYSYICTGADLNRNWPFHWKEAGASMIPCAENYAGVKAESEAETQSLRRYLDSLLEKPNKVRVYVSLHSYSQLLMYPWGYTSELPKTHEELDAVAAAAAKAAARRFGTKLQYGPIASTIYPASGSTLDYAFDKGVRFPFVFELRDDGTYGFLLPTEQIKPTAEETADAIATIASEAAKRK